MIKWFKRMFGWVKSPIGERGQDKAVIGYFDGRYKMYKSTLVCNDIKPSKIKKVLKLITNNTIIDRMVVKGHVSTLSATPVLCRFVPNTIGMSFLKRGDLQKWAFSKEEIKYVYLFENDTWTYYNLKKDFEKKEL